MNSVGFDCGGTHGRAALVEVETGQVLSSQRLAWTDRSPAAVVETLAQLYAAVVPGGTTPSLGVAFAAQLEGSVVRVAPNLGWRDVPLGALLEKRFGRPVPVVNDLKAAAWGEFKAGVARGETDTYTCFVGSGVGSAIIAGGRMVMGAKGFAGEVGHVKVVPEGGRACGCGEVGCLEAYAGGHRLEMWMKEEGLEGGVVDLEQQAFAGHPTAQRLWGFATENLALVLANQVTVLNPGALVLGGGVLSRCPRMMERVIEVIGKRALAVSRESLKCLRAALGDDAGVVGAALLV